MRDEQIIIKCKAMLAGIDLMPSDAKKAHVHLDIGNDFNNLLQSAAINHPELASALPTPVNIEESIQSGEFVDMRNFELAVVILQVLELISNETRAKPAS